ncbi:MAG: transaldolase family protein [Cyanobacteria bacterium P01_H01_bin.15]
MIYLDSACVEEARTVAKWSWVKGMTTNPTLLAATGINPAVTLQQLALISEEEVFYQLYQTEFQEMLKEGKKAKEIVGDKLVLKVPATDVGFQVVAWLKNEITCSVTGIYHPAQAAVAEVAGAKYAIAYVNRATRLLGDGFQLVKDMASVLAGTETEILAASLKSSDEAAQALAAGAHHLTLPLDILTALTTHPLSEKTFAEFQEKGRGLAF